MKANFTPIKIFALTGILATGLTIYGFAQVDEEKKKKKTEKRIEIVDENGQKKVTVTTIIDGKKTIESFAGEEAEKFLENESYGNGNFHMRFDFDIDTISGRNSFDISMNGFGDEFEKEMKEMLKELEQSGTQLQFDLEKMLKSLDSSFSHNNFKMHTFNFNNLDSVFNGNFDFDIQINDHENNESEKHGKRKVIIAHSVIMEDMNKKKESEKEIHVSDLSFYPNPSQGNFTLRYKSESLDKIDIRVTDVNGKTVYNEIISATGTVLRNIELQEPSGVYILTLQQGKKQVSKKLVIE